MNHLRLGMVRRRRRMGMWQRRMGMGLGMVIHRRVVVRLFMVRRLWVVILLVMDRIMRLRMVHWFLMVGWITAILWLLIVVVFWFIGMAKSWPVVRILWFELYINIRPDLNAGTSRVVRLIMRVLVVVMEWRSTVGHFWLVIGLRVPVRRPVSVFVRWFMVRLRLIVWFWFMIWCRFMISWSWVIIRVWLSIMFNLIAVMGSL